MFPMWILGCLISLSGSIGAVFGTSIQKLSFRKNEALPICSRRVYWKQGLWLLGLFFVFIGGCTDFVALGLAPQSTIAALGSISLAANVFLAHFWLGEAIGVRDLIGTVLIVVGSTLSVVFGDHRDTTYCASELKDLYGQLAYVIYGSILIVALVLMYSAVSWKLTPMRVKLVEAIDSLNTMQLEANLSQAQSSLSLGGERSMSQPSLLDEYEPIDSKSESSRSEPHQPNGRSLSEGQLISVVAAGVAGDDVLAAEALVPAKTPSKEAAPISPSVTAVQQPKSDDPRQPLLPTAILVEDANGRITPSNYHPAASILSARALVENLERQYSFWCKVHPIFYCAISGIFGAESLLFGKSVAELFATTMSQDGANQFTDPLTYVFMLALGICLIGQLHFFATALEYFDALFVVPVFKCFFLTLSTLGGALYFQEFEDFKVRQWIIFPFGLCLNLYGVYVLSSRDMSIAKEKDTSTTQSLIGDQQSLEDSIRSLNEDLIPKKDYQPEDIEADILSAEQQQQAFLAQATEELLKEAVEIAQGGEPSSAVDDEEEDRVPQDMHLTSPSRRRPSYGRAHSAAERVLLVTSPMDGVVLVASPAVHSTILHSAASGSSLADPHNAAFSPVQLSRQPTVVLDQHGQPHRDGSTTGADGDLPNSASWVSPESGASRVNSHPGSLSSMASSSSELPDLTLDIGSVAYPNLGAVGTAPITGRGSVFSPSLSAGGMEVSVFSLPNAALPGDYLRSATTAPSRSVTGSPGFGPLRRTTSEQQSSGSNGSSADGSTLSVPGSVNHRGSLATLRTSATFTRPPTAPRPSPRGVAKRPSDILVQRGSLIYRMSGPGNSTPLDASRQSASEDSQIGDSVAVFLTPGAGSSFSVQSPSGMEYRMPRRESIFAHTRTYMKRLSQVATRGNGMISPASSVGSATSPVQRGYTAPSLRTTEQSQALSPFQQPQQTHSDIGPSTYARLQTAGEPSTYQMDSSELLNAHHDILSLAATGSAAPAPTPAATYVPSAFLAQSFRGQNNGNDEETTSTH